MKKIMLILAILLGIAALALTGAGIYITRGLENGKALAIQTIDLSKFKDGTYIGTYQAGRFSNQIEVIIANQKITGIKALKDVSFPQPDLTKQLFERVIQKQSLQVDVLSGATVTSKAYLKGIENALSGN